MVISLRILIILSMFTVFYLLFKDKYNGLNEEALKLFEDKYSEYRENQIRNKNNYIKKRKSKVVVKVEELIKSAQINEVVPFLNAITFLIASFITMVIGYIIIASLLKGNIPLQIEGAVLGACIPYLVLNILAADIENQIDEDIEAFISTGQAYAKTNSNIIYILQSTIEDMSGPVKRIIVGLLDELEGGTNIEVAFNNAINKTQNIRFQELLKKLLIARLEQGNYVQVFLDAENTYDNYFETKQKTLSEMAKVRKSVLVLMVSIVGTCLVCAKAFVGVKETVLTTMPGHLIMGYFGIVMIKQIFFNVETRRFKY